MLMKGWGGCQRDEQGKPWQWASRKSLDREEASCHIVTRSTDLTRRLGAERLLCCYQADYFPIAKALIRKVADVSLRHAMRQGLRLE